MSASPSAEQSLREGNLAEALSLLQDDVRKDAGDAAKRIFLFQLLAVTGQWKRAVTQLQVLAEMQANTLPMAQAYREAIGCEQLRGEVFAGRKTPLIFGEPEPWLADLLQALERSAAGSFAEAATHRERAFEAAPAAGGRLDGEPFEWIADADMRLGPVLEAIVNGKYYWVPFHRIRSITLEQPTDLRDMVWTPAQFEWANGGQAVGLIPTRYPGTEALEDDAARLARKTEWDEPAEGLFIGHGQRLLTTDGGDKPLLEVRSIEFDVDPADADDDEAVGSTDG